MKRPLFGIFRGGHFISDQINRRFVVIQRYFQNLIREITASIEFIQDFLKQSPLQVQIHSHRTIQADDSRMEINTGILAFGPRRVTRPTEVVTVAGDENPILFQNDALEFPILPSRAADPDHMRSLMVPPLPRHEREFGAETFVDQQLGHVGYVSTFLRLETTRAFAGSSRWRGLPRCGFASAKSAASSTCSRLRLGYDERIRSIEIPAATEAATS